MTARSAVTTRARGFGPASAFHVKFKRYLTDFAEPLHGWRRRNFVGYRFCFGGRAIGSGWQGPPNFREWGGPTQGKGILLKQSSDGLACPGLVTGIIRPFD
jgi:hypothetical protein